MRKLKTILGAFGIFLLGFLLSAQSALAATNTTEMVDEATDMIYALWPLLILMIVIGLVVGLIKKFTNVF